MNELIEPSGPTRSHPAADDDAVASGQNGSRGDGTAGFRETVWPARLAGAALEAGAAAVTRLAFDAYVGPCTVLHRERFPRTGATLVIANHPATWMDVVVLDGALGRPLHFLAQDTLVRRPATWWHAAWLEAAYDRWRVGRLRQTHPALYARIAAARALLAGPTRGDARPIPAREV